MEVKDSIHASADLPLRENTLYPFDGSQNGPREKTMMERKIAAVTEEWSLSFRHGQVHNGRVIPCRQQTADLHANSTKYYNPSIA